MRSEGQWRGSAGAAGRKTTAIVRKWEWGWVKDGERGRTAGGVS
jgi:hypothetical protein